jgi:hypothetical protein
MHYLPNEAKVLCFGGDFLTANLIQVLKVVHRTNTTAKFKSFERQIDRSA